MIVNVSKEAAPPLGRRADSGSRLLSFRRFGFPKLDQVLHHFRDSFFFPALPILGPRCFETDSEIFDAMRNQKPAMRIQKSVPAGRECFAHLRLDRVAIKRFPSLLCRMTCAL